MWSVMVVASEAAEKSMIAVSLSLVHEFDSADWVSWLNYLNFKFLVSELGFQIFDFVFRTGFGFLSDFFVIFLESAQTTNLSPDLH